MKYLLVTQKVWGVLLVLIMLTGILAQVPIPAYDSGSGSSNSIPRSPDPERPYARHAKVRLEVEYLVNVPKVTNAYVKIKVKFGTGYKSLRITSPRKYTSGTLTVTGILKNVGGKPLTAQALKPYFEVEAYFYQEVWVWKFKIATYEAKAYAKGTVGGKGYVYGMLYYSGLWPLGDEMGVIACAGSQHVRIITNPRSGERIEESESVNYVDRLYFYASARKANDASEVFVGDYWTEAYKMTLLDYTRTVRVETRDLKTGKILPAVVKLVGAVDGNADGKTDTTAKVEGSGYVDYVWRGVYSIEAPERVVVGNEAYVFYSWEGKDGVNIAGDPESPSSNAGVSDDGVLIAWYLKEEPPPAEYLVRVVSIDGSSTPFYYYVTTDGSSEQRNTPYNIRRTYPFTVRLKRLDNGMGWQVKWYTDRDSFDSDMPAKVQNFDSSEILIAVDNAYPYARAVILKGSIPPPPPPDSNKTPYWRGYVLEEHVRYVVARVEVHVAYTDAYGNYYGADYDHLMPDEYFSAFISIKIGHKTTTSKKLIDKYYYDGSWHDNPPENGEYKGEKLYDKNVRKYPVTCNIRIKCPEWANYVEHFSKEHGPRCSKATKTCNFKYSSDGYFKHKIGVWLVNHEVLGNEDYIIQTFAVEYSWSNGYGDKSSGTITVKVIISRVRPKLYWLPVGADQALIVIAYKWLADDTIIKGRDYLAAKLADIVLEGSLFENVKPMLKLAKASMDSKTAISYAMVSIGDIEQPAINAELKLIPQCIWALNKTIIYHELAMPIYELRTEGSMLRVRLKLIDWATMKPLQGWVMLIVKDLDSGEIKTYLKEAKPFAEFSTPLPDKYGVWAVGIAQGEDTIYSNLKYARILLARNPLA